MPSLTLPTPELKLTSSGGVSEFEKPVPVDLGTITFPDAQPVTKDEVGILGVFVYRGFSGSEEVWDEKNKTWKSSSSDLDLLAQMTPIPLAPTKDEPKPWKGMLVAAGQKDSAGHDSFAAAISGVPRYRLRAFAVANRSGVNYRGLSAPSTDWVFVKADAKKRFNVEVTPADSPDVVRARILLKNGALATAGYVELRTTGGQVVEIANCSSTGAVLARVTLEANGDISLAPAPGRNVVINGNLSAQEIEYQPNGGGARITL